MPFRLLDGGMLACGPYLVRADRTWSMAFTLRVQRGGGRNKVSRSLLCQAIGLRRRVSMGTWTRTRPRRAWPSELLQDLPMPMPMPTRSCLCLLQVIPPNSLLVMGMDLGCGPFPHVVGVRERRCADVQIQANLVRVSEHVRRSRSPLAARNNHGPWEWSLPCILPNCSRIRSAKYISLSIECSCIR